MADFLFVSSVVLFLGGIIALILRSNNIKFKIRYLFLLSMLCFALTLVFGWEDAKQGFMDGYRDGCCCENESSEVIETTADTTESQQSQ